MATPPSFISTDINKVLSEIISYYEQETGKVLQPAQPEMLLINAFAYREGLLRQAIQDAATQNLVDFATAPVLDYLGALLGVVRLAPTAAKVTIRLTLASGYSAFVVPSGYRVGSANNAAVFALVDDLPVSPSLSYIDADFECVTPGATGNGFAIGTITEIFGGSPQIDSASNTTVSGSGADAETDEQLRARIKLAPGSFSTAGSYEAYRYWAFTAHASIIDVAITSPDPGKVTIYPLTADDSPTPTPVLNAVAEVCSSKKVRPLTDTVVVSSPSAVNYGLHAKLTLYTWANQADVEDAVNTALENYAKVARRKMGVDIVPAQIVKAVMSASQDIYDVEVYDPSATVVIGPTEFPNIGTITVQTVGTTNG